MKKLMVLYKVAVALLVFVAIAVQLAQTLSARGGIVNFFSFFTIESNIFGATMLLLSAVFVRNSVRSQTLDYWRGAATLYMVVTGIVYTTILTGTDATLYPWVNTLLHYVFPVVMLADWLLDRPRLALSFRKALLWLAFPVAYLAYSLLRGPIAQWYPYPFLDPREQGYLPVALTAGAILAAGIVLIFLLVKYTQLFKKANRN